MYRVQVSISHYCLPEPLCVCLRVIQCLILREEHNLTFISRALATVNNLIYFPSGTYVVTSTILIPRYARITGEVWSQLAARGPYFADMARPQVMIRVGNVGDIGTVEISDMLFTSIGALPGLIMMEWNVQAETKGSVGMWDAHFRVGK